MMIRRSMERRQGDDDDVDDNKGVEQKIVNKYGDGVAWCRGVMIGKGSFRCVYLATLKKPRSKYSYLPSVIAVKSAEVSLSGSIQKEKEVLSNVKGCSSIIQCFGEETTIGDNGDMIYNLLLEYGSGGTLADRIKSCWCGGIGGGGGKALPEFEVRVYTKSILRGLNHIHGIGYVHCDMKPDNILLVPNSGKGGVEFRAKIGDFGLAKRAKQNKKRKLEPYWRGTPMYLSPEAVEDSVQEAPCDIWALGCIVLEMLTGKPPWDGKGEMNAEEILKRIGEGHELPKIPTELSTDAKSFLKGCFVRKAMFRLTAEMLLNHPFVEGLIDDDEVQEFEDVEDVFGAESILFVAETEDEFSYSSFSDDWEYASDEESISYSSEEDAKEFENDAQSTEEITNSTESNIGAGCDHSIKSSIQAPPPVSSNHTKQFPVKFTISAGV